MKDPEIMTQLRFHLRALTWAMVIATVLVLAVGFTILPDIGSTAAELIGLAIGLFAVSAGYGIAVATADR